MYSELKVKYIIDTVETLEHRINERFPGSGLGRVCHTLLDIGQTTEADIQKISKPNRWIRAGVISAIFLFIFLLVYTGTVISWKYTRPDLIEFIQITEAFINDLILLGAALFFLMSLELRHKRTTALKALHELRSLAHIVDMHQLTKDPSVLRHDQNTDHSPRRVMTEFELMRYLDYCSEIFSLISKLAAMYSEKLPDSEIVSASNDVENLCNGLSRKVWQKMVFLEANKPATALV